MPAPNAVLSLLPHDRKRRCVEGKCACKAHMCRFKTCDKEPLEVVVAEEDNHDEVEIDLDENEGDENFVIDFN